MALLFAAPAWFVFDRITPSLAFTALAASTAMLPDVDLYLMRYFFIEHHGLTHSILFTVPTALVLGGIAAGAYLAVRDGNHPSGASVYGFAVVALFTGMLAHQFADVLTSPDIAPPVKPLWPVLKARLVLDAAFVKSNLWNLGTFALGLAVQGGLGAEKYFR
jgi:membrane-bound metal-dependent hydrolase YbcI (DUF457 family)